MAGISLTMYNGNLTSFPLNMSSPTTHRLRTSPFEPPTYIQNFVLSNMFLRLHIIQAWDQTYYKFLIVLLQDIVKL